VQAGSGEELAPAYRVDLFGDVAVAGVGLRGVGTGTIQLENVPAGAQVVKALVYWATLGKSNSFASLTLNGVKVGGSLIGTAGPVGWGESGNFSYQAEVTHLVPGNGSYEVGMLPAGTDPAREEASQGAALVVLYVQAGAPHRTVIVNHGAVALTPDFPIYTDTIAGYNSGDSMAGARATYLVADGQVEWPDGDLTLAGAVIASNIFSATDGPYWDSPSLNVEGLAVSKPFTTTINRNVAGVADRDRLVWVATVFSAGSNGRTYLPAMLR
jgi:hypothetical protein